MQIPPTRPLACVEVGGGGVQSVLFTEGLEPRIEVGPVQPPGFALAFAVPGIISDGVVREASNLGWRDTDPVEELGLDGPAEIVLNDAEAAALGEAALRGDTGLRRLVYLGIGTGVGGAVVSDGRVLRANLFGHNAPGHGSAFGHLPCRCERRGCLETVAGGWALPDPLDDETVIDVAHHLATAIETLDLASEGIVVLGGGITRRYPALVDEVGRTLGDRRVEPSLAPAGAKSAAAWGLRYALTGAESRT